MKLKFSLKKKFYFAFAMILLVIFGGGMVSMVTCRSISQQYSNMDNDIVPGAMTMSRIKCNLTELAVDLNKYVITRSEESEEQLLRVFGEMNALLDRHYEHEKHIGSQEKAAAIDIKSRCETVVAMTKEAMELANNSRSKGEVAFIQSRMYEIIEDAEAVLDTHLDRHKAELADAGKKLKVSLIIGQMSLVASTVLAFVIVLGVCVLISIFVLRPLAILKAGAASIGQGQLDHRVEISTGDETEELAEQFNTMAEALSKSYRQLEDKVKERTAEIQKVNRGLESEIETRRRVEASLRDAKKQADEANRLKSVFLANMSHEIRTPLNAIIGFAESNIVDTSIENTRKQSGTILSEAETLLALINDLLDNAKIEAGKLELEERAFDLRQMLQRIVSSINLRTHAKGLEFNLDLDDRVPQYIVADALRIHQVLVNLLTNAIKFTEKGSVTLSIETLEREEGVSQLKFAVVDTGIGIAEDKQKDIFESFTQADSSTTRKYGGTGLGTTISRQLLELMDSHISLESELGKGSTFWFVLSVETVSELPEGQSQCDDEDIHDRRAYPRRKGNILVAEDYPPNQQVITMLLQTGGHTVTIAENGRKAVKAAETDSFDLIFMDIQMPEMNGYEAARAIRSSDSACAEIPILALTANADAETKRTCLEAGMDGVMTKPVRRKKILATLNKWLADPRSQGALDDVQQAEFDDCKPIDIETAIEEFGGDAEIVNQVVVTFIEEAETQIKSIIAALDAQDSETIRKEAHKIRGAAGNLVAMPLSQAAEELEMLIMDGRIDDAPEKIKAVEHEFTRLKESV